MNDCFTELRTRLRTLYRDSERCTTEDKLLIEVAREFCIDPVLLDDMMIAADYMELERQVARHDS